MLNFLPREFAGLFPKKQEISSSLNQARVALDAGNLNLAQSHAYFVLKSKRASRNSRFTAELVLIQVKARQGSFLGLLDQLERLFSKISKSNPELQARIGNEILRVCNRSGNFGFGALRGEELLHNFSSHWPEAEKVELLCQLSSCHFHYGDAERADEVATLALSLAENSKKAKALTQSYWQSSYLNINRGDLFLAYQQVIEAKYWAQVAGLRDILPILNNNAALIMLDLPNADLSQIHNLAESAYLDMASQNNPGGSAYACQILSEIALRQEDFEGALMYAERGLRDLPPEISGPKTALLVQVAKVRTRMRRLEEAMADLVAATEHMEHLNPSRELARQWGDIARVFVEAGLTDRGVYAYEKAIQMSGLLREEEDSKVI